MPRVKNSNIWFQQALHVAELPSSSDWLKKALTEAINRDPAKVAAEAETLCRILKLRAAAAQHRSAVPEATSKSPRQIP
jgi:hypothetical protein